MRVAVIGAGVCGLVAARRLARAGHAVDVYERWPGLGGGQPAHPRPEDGDPHVVPARSDGSGASTLTRSRTTYSGRCLTSS